MYRLEPSAPSEPGAAHHSAGNPLKMSSSSSSSASEDENTATSMVSQFAAGNSLVAALQHHQQQLQQQHQHHQHQQQQHQQQQQPTIQSINQATAAMTAAIAAHQLMACAAATWGIDLNSMSTLAASASPQILNPPQRPEQLMAAAVAAAGFLLQNNAGSQQPAGAAPQSVASQFNQLLASQVLAASATNGNSSSVGSPGGSLSPAPQSPPLPPSPLSMPLPLAASHQLNQNHALSLQSNNTSNSHNQSSNHNHQNQSHLSHQLNQHLGELIDGRKFPTSQQSHQLNLNGATNGNHHTNHHHHHLLGPNDFIDNHHHHHSSIQTQQQLLATKGFNPLAASLGQQTEILTPTHLKKAKLMFFYVRYPNSTLLKECFRDVRFNKNNMAQLVKWFSNFREFYYNAIHKAAKDAVDRRVQSTDDIKVPFDHDLINQLNNHYNKNRHIELPDVFREVVEETLKHFFDAVFHKLDETDHSYKKRIYKEIARLDRDIPEFFKEAAFNELLE